MKRKLRVISLCLIAILMVISVINRDKIDVYAKSKGLNKVEIGDVFKNGDVLDATDGVSDCDFYNSITSCYTFTYIVFNYYDENGDFISSSSFDIGNNSMYSSNDTPVIDNSYSEYWKLDYYFEQCNAMEFEFVPVEYKEPTYEIKCNPSEISSGEESVCELKTTYYSKFNNIKFRLDTDDYNIVDIVAGENFTNLKNENCFYSLDGKDMEESDTGLSAVVVRFRIKSTGDKEITKLNNVQVQNLEYSNAFGNKTVDVLTDTVKQRGKKTPSTVINQIVENPSTGRSLLVLVILLVVSITSLIITRKQTKQVTK